MGIEEVPEEEGLIEEEIEILIILIEIVGEVVGIEEEVIIKDKIE